MEGNGETASFNGGLYHRPNNLHATRSGPESSRPPAGLGQHLIARRVDAELSVFGADRYFSEGNNANERSVSLDGMAESCALAANPRDSSISSHNGRSGSYQATPTASSEVSCNTKSALLSHPRGSVAVTVRAFPLREPRKSPSSGTRWFFGRSCPCSGKKSVDVEEKHPGTKSPIPSYLESNPSLSSGKQNFVAGEVGLSSIPNRAAVKEFKNQFDVEEMMKVKITPGNRSKDRGIFNVATRLSPETTLPSEIDHRILNSSRPFIDSFSFPILNPPSSSLAQELPRDSLEVFQPKESAPVRKKSAEFQRRVAVMPYPGKGDLLSLTYPSSPKSRQEEDAASDASSDLFEIESLSTQMMYRRRDSLEELDGLRFSGSGTSAGILQLRRHLQGPAAPPSVDPNECHPPSEASVEWGVTTAEGFDSASAASNYDTFHFIEAEHDRNPAAMGGRETCS